MTGLDVRGRWALVTGGARRLGRGIALGLAEAGANVVVHYGGSAAAAESTADEIRGLGGEAVAVQADLRRPEEIERLFATVERECGALSVLVNSAAGFERGSLTGISSAEWDAAMELNLRGPFLCLQKAAGLMRRGGKADRESGVVVNIADLSGIQAWSRYAAHGVSKAGLVHLTRVAAKELAPEVRVNCVVPGAILPPPGMADDHPDWRLKAERIPVRRVGAPWQVADAVLFLVRNPFVTGVVLPVDGGEHLIGAQPVET